MIETFLFPLFTSPTGTGFLGCWPRLGLGLWGLSALRLSATVGMISHSQAEVPPQNAQGAPVEAAN